MTREERLKLIRHHETRAAQLRADAADRCERQLSGEEPFRDVPAPQPRQVFKPHEEPAPAAPQSLIETLAEVVGETTGRIERELRDEVARLTEAMALLRADVEQLRQALTRMN